MRQQGVVRAGGTQRLAFRRARIVATIGGLALLAAVPLVTNEYTQYVVNLVLVYALVSVGFNIVIGNLGQLAFANTAFFGIGAYTCAIAMTRADVPFVFALLLSGGISAIAGGLVSIPSLRGIRSYYLAIVTLAFSELMRWVYINASGLTMGSTGLAVPTASVFSLSLASQVSQYYVFLAITLAIVGGTANLLKSRFGRAIVAVRENELAASSLTVDPARYIVLAFMLSGLIVGIAGAMFAVLVGRVVPESFNIAHLVVHFAMVMVGGIGSLGGSLIGAVALTALPELVRGFPGMEEVVFGLVLILVLLFLPSGLVSLLGKWVPWIRQRLYRE